MATATGERSGELLPENTRFPDRYVGGFVLITAVFFVFNCADPFHFLSSSFSSSPLQTSTVAAATSSAISAPFNFPSGEHVVPDNQSNNETHRLQRVLQEAATEDKTVIISALNEAWAAPNSMLDLFLESFKLGLNTQRLVDHLVIVAMDEKAFQRCLSIHKHCFHLITPGSDFSKAATFMKRHYLKMMWRRIEFLRTVLEMGYSFVFTDVDIMWFRDPFVQFFPDADFQISCDFFHGNPLDIGNLPNGGFKYVKSNNKSIEFYNFWYKSRLKYRGQNEQDVLNFIKNSSYITEIGLKMRFLDTAYFGGFCQPSKDLNKVCTMHANCCFGMANKVPDLKLMLEDWKKFLALPPSLKRSPGYYWRVPKKCRWRTSRKPKPAMKTNTTGSGS